MDKFQKLRIVLCQPVIFQKPSVFPKPETPQLKSNDIAPTRGRKQQTVQHKCIDGRWTAKTTCGCIPVVRDKPILKHP